MLLLRFVFNYKSQSALCVKMSACVRKCNGGRKRSSLKEQYVVLGKTLKNKKAFFVFLSLSFTLFITLSSFKQCSVDLIFLWEQLTTVYSVMEKINICEFLSPHAKCGWKPGLWHVDPGCTQVCVTCLYWYDLYLTRVRHLWQRSFVNKPGTKAAVGHWVFVWGVRLWRL